MKQNLAPIRDPPGSSILHPRSSFLPSSSNTLPMSLRVRVEQVRQARTIHGGWWNLLAASAGVKLSRMPIPSRRLRAKLFRAVYGRKYGALDESELHQPLSEFRSLNDLFVRPAVRDLAALPVRPGCIASPCDGCVQEAGRLDPDRVLAAKGIPYTLASLLPGIDADPLAGGDFAVLFLSPRDCHRVFAPSDGFLEAVTHVPGARLLVHPPFQRSEFPVFTLNERVVLEYRTDHGRIVLVMVAGWGVGNITHPFPLGLRKRRRRVVHRVLRVPREFRAHDWLATFELGSTVIVLAEPRPGRRFLPNVGDPVHVGQPLFEEPTVP